MPLIKFMDSMNPTKGVIFFVLTKVLPDSSFNSLIYDSISSLNDSQKTTFPILRGDLNPGAKGFRLLVKSNSRSKSLNKVNISFRIFEFFQLKVFIPKLYRNCCRRDEKLRSHVFLMKKIYIFTYYRS
uniref:Uncharacterized protein n=1 Tax=Lepeophtheirus salmonis TaxID=72036 RepID=A0A0K2UQ50_LEPSM